MKKAKSSKHDKPHPMLHGHHDGKMPMEHKSHEKISHKGIKEKEGHMMRAKVKKKTAKVKKK